MSNKLSHFAIYIDDIDRAKSFYREVFQWGFQSYGPGDFLQIKSDDSDSGELIGALQSRTYAPLQEKIIGFECTIQVSDVTVVIEKVKANGGTILMPKTAIPRVGWLTKFQDTEGNIVCAMQSDGEAG
jgi:uncharacterized protein